MDPLKGSLFVYILASFIVCLHALPVKVSGYVDPRFKQVEDVFRKNFESGDETGAAFAVYYKGKLVVDLWGGYTNQEGHIPWRKDTMSIAYSTSKGIAALLAAMFVDRGYLDYKKPVSHYWPEFAQNGKEKITVEMLLSHQAGLIGFDDPISIRLMETDYKKYVSLLAAQKPFWEPGTKQGYHATTFGYYVDVLLTKADPKKRMLDQIFQEEIAEPFGIDFFQGTPHCEQYRIAQRSYIKSFWYQMHLLRTPNFWSVAGHSMFDWDNYQSISYAACKDFLKGKMEEVLTDYTLRSIPMSSFNGYGTARGIAKLFGIVSNGGVHNGTTLLNKTTVDTLEDVVVSGKDVVLGFDLPKGRGLMIMKSPTGSTVFYHPGYGGQMGVGDQKHHLGMGYLTNNLAEYTFIGRPFENVMKAVYKSLEQIKAA